MSKTWKWIIGILIGLMVLAVIIAIPFGMHQLAGNYTQQFPARGFERGFDHDFGPGMMGRGGGADNFYWHHNMMNRNPGFVGPMVYGSGFFFFEIFRLLIPLAVVGLAIYGVFALFRRKPSPVVAAEAAPAVPTRTCASCGKSAQDDWKNCPYCGNAL
jgi:TRAP-type C4-dicarboxylate transport system permease small subunit